MRGKRTTGRRRGRFVSRTIAAGTMLMWLALPDLHAEPSTAQELEAFCTSATAGEVDRAMSLEALLRLDSTESRNAIKRLADSSDDRLAVQSLGALTRRDFSGARTKLASVMEDTSRSDVIRAFALGGWLRGQKKDGKRWADVRSFVESRTEGNAALEAMRDAQIARLWPGEVDGD